MPKRRKVDVPRPDVYTLCDLPADLWEVVFPLVSDSPVWLYAVWVLVCKQAHDMPRPKTWLSLEIGAETVAIPDARWLEWRKISSVTIAKKLPAVRLSILAHIINNRTCVHSLVLPYTMVDQELTDAAKITGLQRLGSKVPVLETKEAGLASAEWRSGRAWCDRWLSLDRCQQVSSEAIAAYLRSVCPRTLLLTDYDPFLNNPLIVASAGGCLRQLGLRGCYTLEDLRWLATLTGLETLDLSGCVNVTDDALAVVAGLQKLTRLDLGRCEHLAARSLERLSGLTSLIYLNLSYFRDKLTNVSFLRSLHGLQKLALCGCDIGNEQLRPLSGLHNLRFLNLGENFVFSDEGLRNLRSLVHLERLLLDSVIGLTGAGFVHLRDLNNLQHLSLHHCTNLNGAHFRNLPHGLRHLYLSLCTGLTGNAVGQLQHLAELRVLNLSRTNVTSAWFQDCGQLVNLEYLVLDACAKLDNGIFQYLAPFRKLKELSIRACLKLKRSAVRAFKIRRPDLVIFSDDDDDEEEEDEEDPAP